jgi:hypothetical protein
MVKYLVFLAMWISIKEYYKHNHGRQGYLYKLWDGGPDRVARRRSRTEWPDREAGRSGPTEKPAISNGRAGQTDTRMGAQRRVDGRSTEGARVPDGD